MLFCNFYFDVRVAHYEPTLPLNRKNERGYNPVSKYLNYIIFC